MNQFLTAVGLALALFLVLPGGVILFNWVFFPKNVTGEPGHEKKRFACAINCIDGRVQEPVRRYICSHYDVDYVDMVTRPGICKILAENQDDSIEKDIGVSARGHGSKEGFLIGHEDCAANPVSKAEQIQQLLRAKKTVEGFGYGFEKIILLWIERDPKTGELEKVERINVSALAEEPSLQTAA